MRRDIIDNVDIKISRGVHMEIEEVIGKCFFVKVYTKNKKIEISNSKVFGNDAPNIFIKSLKKLESKSIKREYLRWEGESEAYIWILDKNKDILDLEIWLGSSNLITIYEGEEVLKEKERLIFSERTSYKRFVQNVKEAFHTYFDFKEEKNHEYEIDFRLLDSLRGY